MYFYFVLFYCLVRRGLCVSFMGRHSLYAWHIVLPSTAGYALSGDIINDVETSILHTQGQTSSRIPTMNPIRIPPDTSSTHLLLTSLILRYQTTLHLRYPADRSIIHGPEKHCETLTDLSKKTAISARSPGHPLVVHRVSNRGLGSFIVKFLNHESINTAWGASVVLR